MELSHVITKKIDESGNLVYWFRLKERPRQDFLIGFFVSFKSGATLEQKEKVKKATGDLSGFVTISIPNEEVESISYKLKTSIFGEWSKRATQIELCDKFEDVTLFENSNPFEK